MGAQQKIVAVLALLGLVVAGCGSSEPKIPTSKLSKLVLLTSTIVGYSYLSEFFSAWR